MKYSHCLQGHHIPVGPTPYIQMLRVFVPTAHFSALLKVPKALNFTPSLLQTSAAASSLHLPLLTDRFSEHLTLGPRPLPWPLAPMLANTEDLALSAPFSS